VPCSFSCLTFLVFGTLSLNAAMSRTQSSSLYSNNYVQRSFPSSEGGGRMVLGLRPICDCGEVVVLRTARTPKNVGRKFWCFANYKVRLI